jgi:hypothetical protein
VTSSDTCKKSAWYGKSRFLLAALFLWTTAALAASGPGYETWPTPSTPPLCDVNPSNSAPLTLFSCSNNNSFEQVFKASATGTLTAYTMNLACLNPAGTPLTGLNALIYQGQPQWNQHSSNTSRHSSFEPGEFLCSVLLGFGTG